MVLSVKVLGKGGNPVASRREYMRVTCESLCILNHNDNNYPVLLENFSMGGALLKVGAFTTGQSAGWHYG